MIKLDWSDFKSFVDDRGLSIQEGVNDGILLYLYAYNGPISRFCKLLIDNTAGSDYKDYVDNYQSVSNNSLEHLDPDTKAPLSSPKIAPTGWFLQYREIEWETSKLNSHHDKDIDNNDFGYTTLKFYDSNDTELLTQGDIDTSCVKTVCEWMPDHDYAIQSGHMKQLAIPSSDMYVWAQVAPGLDVYGISPTPFVEGGLNMKYVNAYDKVGVDGDAATVLKYEVPPLSAGAGTNKMVVTVRHAAGIKHRLQLVMRIYKQ